MEVRAVTVDATNVNDAKRSAVVALRGDRFDPLRILEAKTEGFVRFDGSSSIFRYRVEVQGVTLEENEARGIYGDR